MDGTSAETALARARALTRTSAAAEQATIRALIEQARAQPDLHTDADVALANLHVVLGDYELASEIGLRLIAEGGTAAAAGWNTRGVVLLEQGSWAEALDALERAERLADPNAIDFLGAVANNLGLVCWRLGELELAEEHYARAAARFESTGDTAKTSNVMNNLGLVVEQAGDQARARELFEGAAERLVDHPMLRANALANLADLSEALGELDSAERLLRAVLRTRTELGHRRGVAGARIALARNRLARGRLGEAREHLDVALTLIDQLGLKKHLADAWELQASLHAARGEWEMAYQARLELEEHRKALNREEIQRRVEAARNRTLLQEARREAARRTREAAELKVARNAAESALRARSAFLATTSHELRGPLSVVVGTFDLLRERPHDPEEAELIEAGRLAAALLQTVVEDVLDLSRLDAGVIPLRTAPLEVRAAIERLARLARSAHPKATATLSTAVGPDVPRWVRGDLDRLLQVLLNLTSNALKYTQRGSVQVEVSVEGTGLRFDVVDTGIGVDPAFRDQLFEPFARQETDAVRAQRGAGLGLSIARRLALAMGGWVRLENSGPGGSTFRAWLPLEACRAPAPPADPSSVVPSVRRRVLIVDDDHDVRTVLHTMVEHLGHEAHSAAGAAEARVLLATTRLDIVVVDLRMPDVNGLDLAQEILAQDSAPVVMILSGEADREVRARARKLGVSRVLIKPVGLALLRTVLG